MSDSRTADSTSDTARAMSLCAASFRASSKRSEHTLMRSRSRTSGSSRRCSRPWTPAPMTVATRQSGAAQQACRQHRGRRGADAGDVGAVHHAGRGSGIRIEQVDQREMVGQIVGEVAVEDVDDLDRQLQARAPRRHGEPESLAGHRQRGPRWRLHVAQFQSAKTVFESVQQLAGIETPLDVGLTQRHHLPRAFADFKGRFAGPLSSLIHPMSSSPHRGRAMIGLF